MVVAFLVVVLVCESPQPMTAGISITDTMISWQRGRASSIGRTSVWRVSDDLWAQVTGGLAGMNTGERTLWAVRREVGKDDDGGQSSVRC